MLTVTVTEMKNDFGKYLDKVIAGQEIVLTENGEEVARLTPKNSSVSCLSDSLRGILKKEYDIDEERTEALKNKYSVVD